MNSKSKYDVVIIGGGHNGLVNAAYLARAGRVAEQLSREDGIGKAVAALPF